MLCRIHSIHSGRPSRASRAMRLRQRETRSPFARPSIGCCPGMVWHAAPSMRSSSPMLGQPSGSAHLCWRAPLAPPSGSQPNLTYGRLVIWHSDFLQLTSSSWVLLGLRTASGLSRRHYGHRASPAPCSRSRATLPISSRRADCSWQPRPAEALVCFFSPTPIGCCPRPHEAAGASPRPGLPAAQPGT